MSSLIRIERDIEWAQVIKLNNGLLFALKPANINISRCPASKLAFVPASSCNFDVNESYVKVCAEFHQDCKGFRLWPKSSNLTRSFFVPKNT